MRRHPAPRGRPRGDRAAHSPRAALAALRPGRDSPENATERETLNEALQSRKVIGQAIGIIMERYEMNEDRAFAFLVRASSTSNIKVRDIAQELVDRRNSG